VLFADLKSAFYSIWPEIAVGAVLTTDQRAQVFAAAGLDQAQVATLQELILEEDSLLQQQGVAALWTQLVADWHTCNFFSVEASLQLVQTATGVRPGDAVADLVFVLVFVVVQRDLSTELRARGLVPAVPLRGDAPFGGEGDDVQAVPFLPPTFMDDLAVPVQAEGPLDLLDKMVEVATVLDRVAKKYGLVINFAKGKTECILVLSGAGLAAAKARLLEGLSVEAGGSPEVSLLLPGGVELRVVPRYKHVGVMATAARSHAQELAHRCASGNTASAALSRQVFGKRYLPTSVKLQVASACVNSRVLHAAGTWPTLLPRQVRQVEASLMRPLRRAAGALRPPEEGQSRPSNAQVRAQLGVPAAAARLDVARLRYARRASSHATPALRALLQSPGAASWRREVLAALAAMRGLLSTRLDALPAPVDDGALCEWERFWARFPGPWEALLKRFLKAAASEPARYAQLAAQARGQQEGVDSDSDGEWLCAECGAEFRSRRGLRTHQIHAHGRRREVRRYCLGSVCPTCFGDWHTRLRCLHHMQYGAAACRQAWQTGRLPTFSDEEVAAADAGDRVLRRDCTALGTSELAGPPPVRPPAMP
jgi:hypothetical protein